VEVLLANQAALHLTSEKVPDIFSAHNAMLSTSTDLKGYEQIARCRVCASDRLVQLTQAPLVNYYQCEHCAVIFLNPQPTVETLKLQYTRQGLLETGPARAWYAHANFHLKEIFRTRLRNVLRYKAQGDLLDVGCGMGDFCGLAKEAGFRVFGTEFSDQYAEVAKRRAGAEHIYVGRLQEIDFESKRFDVISLWHVFEHVPDPLPTLVSLKGLVKPGGLISIEVPNVEQNRKRLMYRADIEDYSFDRLEHLFYYSSRALQNTCEQAGLRVLAVNFVDAHQPAKNMVKHVMRKIKRPSKQLLYLGRQNKGFSALRFFVTV
jgi:2-polyprenyl-3-methyl-5-hydroxy-6-metoxy-1,4-benzoquinol methylase